MLHWAIIPREEEGGRRKEGREADTERESKCKEVHRTELATALQKHNLLHGTPLERFCRRTACQTCPWCSRAAIYLPAPSCLLFYWSKFALSCTFHLITQPLLAATGEPRTSESLWVWWRPALAPTQGRLVIFTWVPDCEFHPVGCWVLLCLELSKVLRIQRETEQRSCLSWTFTEVWEDGEQTRNIIHVGYYCLVTHTSL